MKTVMTDCIVIGGGLAGWMAAREAVRAGCRVALLRDGQGASPWVHGVNIPAHPRDSVETFLADTYRSGQGLCKPELAAALCGDAPEMLYEIEKMGLSLNRDGEGYQFLQPLGASWPRVMSVGNETGVAILKAVQAELAGKVQVFSDARAVRLLTQAGAVVGALAFDRKTGTWFTLRGGATVLACGGFCGIYPFTTNKRDSGGDGAAMAFLAGAQLCDMEFIQFEPSGAVWPESLRGTSMITTMFYEGAVLRNRAGERFMLRYGPEGERVNKDKLAMCIAMEIRDGRGTEHGGVYFDATALGDERLQNRYEIYGKRYRHVGIDLAREWIELAPAAHTSLGGVTVDANGAATLPGLYACGEVTGGLHGANRIGGSAGLETLVFGRRAGRAAAAYAGAHAAAEPADAVETVNQYPETAATGGESIVKPLSQLREELQAALAGGAGVLRDGDALAAALVRLNAARSALQNRRGADAGEAFARVRLENDVIAATLVCTAALQREDSTGCHVRTDRPQQAVSPYHVTLRSTKTGAVQAGREPVATP